MMERKHLALVGLVALVVLSGCLNMFSGISDDQLCEGADYDFDTDADATYTLSTNGTYEAVYDVEGRKKIQLYETDGLGNNQPLRIAAVKFRAEDGTVYDCEDIEVETDRRKTTVTLPEKNGTLAYRVDSPPKRFSTQRFVDGSHEVVLPKDRAVRNIVFGKVRPSATNKTTVDGRVHLYWKKVEADRISVRYYMERDVTILLGIIGVAGLAALGGVAYYYRKIQRLEREREQAGLDLDVEDDDRDPPPGMG